MRPITLLGRPDSLNTLEYFDIGRIWSAVNMAALTTLFNSKLKLGNLFRKRCIILYMD